MITVELRSKVDKIWETFWTGGITNLLELMRIYYLVSLFNHLTMKKSFVIL